MQNGIRRILTAAALPAAAAVFFLMAATGCAPRLASFDQRLLLDADSLFKSGDYTNAKARLTKINPVSEYGPKAKYYLGYINIYYNNPAADWEAALVEFRQFAANYPGSDLLPVVNSWIRILVVLQTFKRQYVAATADLKTLQNKPPPPAPRQTVTDQNYNILLESVSRCYTDKDSLANKIRILEEVIEKIEKKR